MIPAVDALFPMIVFFLIAAFTALVLIGIGMVVAAVVLASIAALTGLGIVSSAVIVGLLRGRLSSGLRTFHYLICAFLALPAGIGTLWLGSLLTDSRLSPGEIVGIGSAAGFVSGLALAFLFDRLAAIAFRRLAGHRAPEP